MNKVIIDTDIGVDDALAIAYASHHCDIVGITTVFGNVTVQQAVKNAKLFTEILGINTPIYRGLSRPLAIDPTPVNKTVHGEDGLGGVFNNHHNDDAEDAIRFIIDTIMANPGEITLIPIGPLTNIAAALSQEPRIAECVKQVIIMGGAFGTDGNQGNVTPLSEFNIWKDPHAADQVLSSQMPITMVPLDVTHRVLVTGDEIRKMGHQELIAMTEGYLKYSLEKEKFEGMAVHDALTISYLLLPDAFTIERAPLRVVTEGFATGLTLKKVTELGSRANPFSESRIQNVCINVDSDRVKKHLLTTLQTYKD